MPVKHTGKPGDVDEPIVACNFTKKKKKEEYRKKKEKWKERKNRIDKKEKQIEDRKRVAEKKKEKICANRNEDTEDKRDLVMITGTKFVVFVDKSLTSYRVRYDCHFYSRYKAFG